MRYKSTLPLYLALLLAACGGDNTPKTPKTQVAFVDSGQRLGNFDSSGVTLGDLDNDGDLDALVRNSLVAEPNQIYINDRGTFTKSEQRLGSGDYFRAVLGDIDGDSDLDVILTYTESQAEVYLNENGTFVDSGQRLGSTKIDFNATAWDVALGDIDGDNDLDVYVANYAGEPDQVYLNENGTFTDSGQRLGKDGGMDAALRDLDGDGDLDAFVMNYGGAQVYFNEGGTFVDSEQWLEDYDNANADLRDLDGNNDLDVVIAGAVYLNEAGTFSKSEQRLGDMNVALGDLDGDGDVDAFTGDYENSGTRNVYFNNKGTFRQGAQSITVGNSPIADLALGDLDGDGDLDAFVATDRANRIYLSKEVEVN